MIKWDELKGETYDGADGVFVIRIPADGHYHWVYIPAL